MAVQHEHNLKVKTGDSSILLMPYSNWKDFSQIMCKHNIKLLRLSTLIKSVESKPNSRTYKMVYIEQKQNECVQ